MSEETKTTLRISKPLVKQMKQYALDQDTTFTAVTTQAFEEFLNKKGSDSSPKRVRHNPTLMTED